jgi:hypothetical protein
MKRILIALALLTLLLPEAGAQTGAVIYSLPRTTVSLEVTAQRKAFTAGPYAQYAQKYFGVAARTQNEVTHTLTQITVTPYVEADPAVRYTVNLPDKSSATFLQFCTQGLVVMADNYTGKPASWRFTPQVGTGRFEGADPLGNLGKETTVLYKAIRTEEGYEKVPVNQDQVVEKSPDRKAADIAEMIFSLREKRMQIATGDTDATFEESLKPAIEHITFLEEKYLSLFYGVTEVSEVTRTFDVTPVAGNKSQSYTAFHVSDTKGLLPASQQEGKPYTLEFKIEPLSEAEAAADRSRETVVVHYRIPVITRCRLTQGSELVLESRVPVYQLGEESTFPLNALITK